MDLYVEPIQRIIDEFSKLPGVGHKSAVRLAFYLIESDKALVENFAKTVVLSRRAIKQCGECFNLTDKDLCNICSNPIRKSETICVVESSKDLVAMERTRGYRGKYHVLGGVISPSQGVGTDDIRVDELIKRIIKDKVKEVILATNSNIEGEATASYIFREICNLNVSVSRIAHGIPVGGDLEYADEMTLGRSLDGRVEI